MIIYWIIFGVIVYAAMAFATDTVVAYKEDQYMCDPITVIMGILWPITVIYYLFLKQIVKFVTFCVKEYIQTPIVIYYMRKDIIEKSRSDVRLFWRSSVAEKFCRTQGCETCPLREYRYEYYDCKSWRNKTARNYILNFCGFTNFEEDE